MPSVGFSCLQTEFHFLYLCSYYFSFQLDILRILYKWFISVY